LIEGGERNPAFDYPDEQWLYYMMADKFGWTPDQVDNLPANTADWLLAISATVEQTKAERMSK
jgi:hypothetical protein